MLTLLFFYIMGAIWSFIMTLLMLKVKPTIELILAFIFHLAIGAVTFVFFSQIFNK
jgi:hypothetical protein